MRLQGLRAVSELFRAVLPEILPTCGSKAFQDSPPKPQHPEASAPLRATSKTLQTHSLQTP